MHQSPKPALFTGLTGLVALGAAAASLSLSLSAMAADGLSIRDAAWPRWQTRISITSPASLPAALPGAEVRLVSASLLGDYYFSVPRLLPLSAQGGLRATSGVITVSSGNGLARPSLNSTDALESLPYLGLGYTRLSARGGWGFSADVGLVAQNPTNAWRLGRALLGNPRQDLDDAVRSLRLAPHLQLGVHYKF